MTSLPRAHRLDTLACRRCHTEKKHSTRERCGKSMDTMSNINCSNLLSVNGIVAIITGGGTGIGEMMAHAVAENGATRIYIVGRCQDRLIEAAAKYPNIIVPLQGDITQQDVLKQIAERVKQEAGYINLVVPNAEITGPELEKK